MKVLVGFDGSESAKYALCTAIEYFRPAEAEIVVLGAFQPPASISPVEEKAYDEALEEARRDLKAAADSIRRAGLSGRLRLVEGEPRQVLGDVVGEEKPDLVVVGARGRTALEKVLLGSVSTYAVKHLAVPVLVVRRPSDT